MNTTKNVVVDGWDISVEKCWRERFDHYGSSAPTTNEMARMLDQYGWYKK